MHTRDQLASEYRALGVHPGDTVMLHASLRAIGEVAGGPDQVHLALKDALTPEGTLVMYAGCPRYFDEVGRSNLTAEEEAEVLEKLPAFDANSARSARDNGALVEMLRTYPGSRVNDHVTRFVVWGKHAEHLISEQPWDFAYGHDSTLGRFARLEGKILLAGSDHDNVTFLHHVEHVADFPDKRVVTFKVPVTENGRRVWKEMKEFDTADKAHANWPNGFFGSIVDRYLEVTDNNGGPIGSSRSFLFNSAGLAVFAAEIMKAVASQ